MELREVIGNRRSLRYLDPDHPVEIEKIQRMLEAARIASHFGNNNAAQALVVHRETATEKQWDSLPSPVGGFQMKMAPVVILWYVNMDAMDEAGQRPRLPFETLFQLNSLDTAFPRSQAVTDELTADKLLQPQAPSAEREEEIEALREKYNLPGSGMI